MKRRALVISMFFVLFSFSMFAFTGCSSTSNTTKSKKISKCNKAKAGSACWSNRGAFYTW